MIVVIEVRRIKALYHSFKVQLFVMHGTMVDLVGDLAHLNTMILIRNENTHIKQRPHNVWYSNSHDISIGNRNNESHKRSTLFDFGKIVTFSTFLVGFDSLIQFSL